MYHGRLREGVTQPQCRGQVPFFGMPSKRDSCRLSESRNGTGVQSTVDCTAHSKRLTSPIICSFTTFLQASGYAGVVLCRLRSAEDPKKGVENAPQIETTQELHNGVDCIVSSVDALPVNCHMTELGVVRRGSRLL